MNGEYSTYSSGQITTDHEPSQQVESTHHHFHLEGPMLM